MVCLTKDKNMVCLTEVFCQLINEVASYEVFQVCIMPDLGEGGF